MNGGLLLRLIVWAGLFLLTPLVYANPPDPVWIGGFYDGGDADDVVAAAGSTDGILEVEPLPAARAFPTVVGVLPFRNADHPASTTPLPSRVRAPPALLIRSLAG